MVRKPLLFIVTHLPLPVGAGEDDHQYSGDNHEELAGECQQAATQFQPGKDYPVNAHQFQNDSGDTECEQRVAEQ